MGSRCFIAHIARDGSGRTIYCHKGAPPDDNGATLLEHYQDEKDVVALMNLGSIPSLQPTVTETGEFTIPDGPPAHCFGGGTEGFFGRFWTMGTEWLYCWTPDGWFAAPGHREIPPDSWYEADDTDSDPCWQALDERAAKCQRPQPLVTVIEQYQADKAARTNRERGREGHPK